MQPADLESALARALAADAVPGVISAYLFGSEAEGRGHRESDVDVGVLLDRAAYPTDRARFDARVLLSARLPEAVRGRMVDVVILNDVPPTFARHIVTRGRRIFCPDPRRDHDFVRDVQLLAADLDPWLARMRRIKLEALRSHDVPRRAAG